MLQMILAASSIDTPLSARSVRADVVSLLIVFRIPLSSLKIKNFIFISFLASCATFSEQLKLIFSIYLLGVILNCFIYQCVTAPFCMRYSKY